MEDRKLRISSHISFTFILLTVFNKNSTCEAKSVCFSRVFAEIRYEIKGIPINKQITPVDLEFEKDNKGPVGRKHGSGMNKQQTQKIRCIRGHR